MNHFFLLIYLSTMTQDIVQWILPVLNKAIAVKPFNDMSRS